MADDARQVCLVGWEASELRPGYWDATHQELVYPVVKRLLDRLGMTQAEVEFLSDAASDFLDGRCLTTMTMIDALGGHLVEEVKIEDDGLWALCYARLRILAGACESALVVAYGKSSESDQHWQTNLMADPFFVRALGIDRLSSHALQASAYLASGGGGDDLAAEIASRRRTAASSNPRVVGAQPLSAEEARASGVVMGPLRSTYLPSRVDGACALLLAEASTAKRLVERPILIRAAGHATDRYSLGTRDLTRVESAATAAAWAAERAGWKPADADVLELSGPTPFAEMQLMEALGAAPHLGGGSALTLGDLAQRVNLSGGLLGADPVIATGLFRVIEAAERLHQGADRAVAHAASGLALQANAILLLEAG